MTAQELRTDRLVLRLLTVGELELLLGDLGAFEQALGARYRGRPLEGDLLCALEGQYLLALHSAPDALWHDSMWAFVLHQGNTATVIGSACFGGAPRTGSAWIGYGLGEGYTGHGYATEAVDALAGWALGVPGVQRICAETMPENLASQRVLARCDFHRAGQTDEGNLWQRAAGDRHRPGHTHGTHGR